MSDSKETFDWSKTTFEGSRREQLRRFRALSLREKMQAIEGMAALVQEFAEMRRRGAFRSQDLQSGAESRVSDSAAEFDAASTSARRESLFMTVYSPTARRKSQDRISCWSDRHDESRWFRKSFVDSRSATRPDVE